MTSAKFERLFVFVGLYQMDHPRTVFLKGEWLQHQVVAVSGYVRLHIRQSVRNTIWSEHIGVWFLADFALELFPSVGNEVFVLLLYHLLLEPKLEALIMNETHWAVALARVEQWIFDRGGIVPAYLALDVWVVRRIDDTAVYFDGFLLEFLIEWVQGVVIDEIFLRRLICASNSPSDHLSASLNDLIHLLLMTIATWIDLIALFLASTLWILTWPVILHIEFYSAELDRIASVQFIVLNTANRYTVSEPK